MLGYFEHVYKLPMKFFASRKTGEITTRYSDASTIKSVLTSIAMSVVMDIVMAVGTGFVPVSYTHLDVYKRQAAVGQGEELDVAQHGANGAHHKFFQRVGQAAFEQHGLFLAAHGRCV